MASQGPNSAGTGANVTGVGTVAWLDPGNITASDDAKSSPNFGNNATTNYLRATNFGFSIPAGATIDGIEVFIERDKDSTTTVVDNVVSIVTNLVIGSENKASGTGWPSLDATATYGGAADLWGETWTDEDINSANFGVVLSASITGGNNDANVDHIQITVHYTEGVSGPSIPVVIHHLRQQQIA